MAPDPERERETSLRELVYSGMLVREPCKWVIRVNPELGSLLATSS